MDTGGDARVDAKLKAHRHAVDAFFTRAAQVTSHRWNVPRAEGKWSPAREVKHVVLSYEAFTRDLMTGIPMKLIGTRYQRLKWRALGMASVLWLKKLPKGAPAPREARPPEGPFDQEALLAELREKTEEFEDAFRRAWAAERGRRVTHPYFGALSLADALELAKVHTLHHMEVLPPPGARQEIGA